MGFTAFGTLGDVDPDKPDLGTPWTPTAARCSLRRFHPRRQPCRITAAVALLPFISRLSFRTGAEAPTGRPFHRWLASSTREGQLHDALSEPGESRRLGHFLPLQRCGSRTLSEDIVVRTDSMTPAQRVAPRHLHTESSPWIVATCEHATSGPRHPRSDVMPIRTSPRSSLTRGRPSHRGESDRLCRTSSTPTPVAEPPPPMPRIPACHPIASSPGLPLRAAASCVAGRPTSGPCSTDESETTTAVASRPSPVPSLGLLPLRGFFPPPPG